MRLLIDSLIAMMLIAILAGVIFHHRQQQDLVRQYNIAHRELASLRDTITYNSALEQATLNESGHALYPSPLWFPNGLPSNRLVPGRHPWFDIAPQGDLNDQPPDPIIHSHDQAGYWYNPNLGIIRARVMPLFTEQATLTLYNQINTTMLGSLPRSKDPARQPIPHPLLSGPLNADLANQRQTLLNRPEVIAADQNAEADHSQTLTLISSDTVAQKQPATPTTKPATASQNQTSSLNINTAVESTKTSASLRSTTLLRVEYEDQSAGQHADQSVGDSLSESARESADRPSLRAAVQAP